MASEYLCASASEAPSLFLRTHFATASLTAACDTAPPLPPWAGGGGSPQMGVGICSSVAEMLICCQTITFHQHTSTFQNE
jgi:hypothetical protein